MCGGWPLFRCNNFGRWGQTRRALRLLRPRSRPPRACGGCPSTRGVTSAARRPSSRHASACTPSNFTVCASPSSKAQSLQDATGNQLRRMVLRSRLWHSEPPRPRGSRILGSAAVSYDSGNTRRRSELLKVKRNLLLKEPAHQRRPRRRRQGQPLRKGSARQWLWTPGLSRTPARSRRRKATRRPPQLNNRCAALTARRGPLRSATPWPRQSTARVAFGGFFRRPPAGARLPRGPRYSARPPKPPPSARQ